MWECGLKHLCGSVREENNGHSPCGSVDWNLCLSGFWAINVVTPHVGVWIETGRRDRKKDYWESLPMWECGLKRPCPRWGKAWESHSPCGSVDWNFAVIISFFVSFSHSPCGSVDWNRFEAKCADTLESLPTWECGLKLSNITTHHITRMSLPMWECGLKL